MARLIKLLLVRAKVSCLPRAHYEFAYTSGSKYEDSEKSEGERWVYVDDAEGSRPR